MSTKTSDLEQLKYEATRVLNKFYIEGMTSCTWEDGVYYINLKMLEEKTLYQFKSKNHLLLLADFMRWVEKNVCGINKFDV